MLMQINVHGVWSINNKSKWVQVQESSGINQESPLMKAIISIGHDSVSQLLLKLSRSGRHAERYSWYDTKGYLLGENKFYWGQNTTICVSSKGLKKNPNWIKQCASCGAQAPKMNCTCTLEYYCNNNVCQRRNR